MVRTDFDRGAAFQRPLTSGKPKPATMRFRPFSSAQVATFEDFFEQTLGMGSSKFEMPHPFTGLVRVWRFRDVENPYQIEPLGRAHYTVSVNLELFPV
ncbi:MAG: hypothetical protein CMM07_25560 [Rhodopirellula sp.]|nr:hypothetical protein [Rhodopirellula sp.]